MRSLSNKQANSKKTLKERKKNTIKGMNSGKKSRTRDKTRVDSPEDLAASMPLKVSEARHLIGKISRKSSISIEIILRVQILSSDNGSNLHSLTPTKTTIKTL